MKQQAVATDRRVVLAGLSASADGRRGAERHGPFADLGLGRRHRRGTAGGGLPSAEGGSAPGRGWSIGSPRTRARVVAPAHRAARATAAGQAHPVGDGGRTIRLADRTWGIA